ncbi:MAG: hypothetical protein NT142_02780 [Planctomycetota bacterium]|nr:hypothetical protein [Planctomycetota bacterium]
MSPVRELTRLLVIPSRPHRSEPRVIKRRGKPFKILNKPRNVLRKALAEMEFAA